MIIYQKFIFRDDLRRNPNVLYLFGDNMERVGLGGQAKEMRGEPNAVGIATKRRPSMSEGEFFSDDDYDEVIATMRHDMKPAIEHLKRGGVVVIPTDGLGTGLSELPQRAPEINRWLVNRLWEMGFI